MFQYYMFQYFLEYFWNFTKVHQNWTPRPFIYHQKQFAKYQSILKTYFGFPKCCQFPRRRAPKNDQESSQQILNILAMKQISIKEHE